MQPKDEQQVFPGATNEELPGRILEIALEGLYSGSLTPLGLYERLSGKKITDQVDIEARMIIGAEVLEQAAFRREQSGEHVDLNVELEFILQVLRRLQIFADSRLDSGLSFLHVAIERCGADELFVQSESAREIISAILGFSEWRDAYWSVDNDFNIPAPFSMLLHEEGYRLYSELGCSPGSDGYPYNQWISGKDRSELIGKLGLSAFAGVAIYSAAAAEKLVRDGDFAPEEQRLDAIIRQSILAPRGRIEEALTSCQMLLDQLDTETKSQRSSQIQQMLLDLGAELENIAQDTVPPSPQWRYTFAIEQLIEIAPDSVPESIFDDCIFDAVIAPQLADFPQEARARLLDSHACFHALNRSTFEESAQAPVPL